METIPGREGMAALTLIVGVAAGIGTAYGLWGLFGLLRARKPEPAVTLGTLATTLTVGVAAINFLIWYFQPRAPVSFAGLILALVLVTLMLILAGVAVRHQGHYGLGWGKSFLILMAEAGVAVLVAFALNALRYVIADIIRGGSDDVDDILTSFVLARNMLLCFDVTLSFGLLFMEACRWHSRRA